MLTIAVGEWCFVCVCVSHLNVCVCVFRDNSISFNLVVVASVRRLSMTYRLLNIRYILAAYVDFRSGSISFFLLIIQICFEWVHNSIENITNGCCFNQSDGLTKDTSNNERQKKKKNNKQLNHQWIILENARDE